MKRFLAVISVFVMTACLLVSCIAPATSATQTAAAAEAGEEVELTFFERYGSLIFLLVMILFFWLVLIRPQKKRDKEAKAMMAALQKGDKVITIGGIRGTVSIVRDNTVVVKVDENTRIEFSKSAISSVVKNEEKAAEPVAEVKEDKDGGDKGKGKKKKLTVVEKPEASK